MRPKIPGLILGVFIISLARREFAPKGGSAPLTRLAMGVCMMVGAMMFIGCPTTMLLRLARGEMNAIFGLVGFTAGIFAGMFFLNKGFTLKRTYSISKSDGLVLPIISVLLLVALLAFPALLNFSEAGFASFRAPVVASLIGGLLIGGLAFISRFCTVAAIRDSIFFKSFSMLAAFIGFLAVLAGYNLVFGHFDLGFEAQPFAHTNILSMGLVGFVASLVGGCPFRQIVLAGSGNSDAAVTVLGMTFGAALIHNLGLASNMQGPSDRGPIGFVIAATVAVGVAAYNTFFRTPAQVK